MSYESIVKVLDSGLGDATLTSVLVALARFENRDTGACYPTTARIALAARRSELTVRKALKELEAGGLISSHQAPGKVRTFRLHLDALPPQDVYPPKEVEGEGVKNLRYPPSKTLGGGGKELYPETVIETVIEKVTEKVSSAPASGSVSEPQVPAFRFEKSGGVKAPGLDHSPSARPSQVSSAPVFSSLPGAAEELEAQSTSPLDPWAALEAKHKPAPAPAPAPTPAKSSRRSCAVEKPEDVSQDVWDEYTALRRKKRATVSALVLKALRAEAQKAGLTLEQAMTYQVCQGWQGFRASWVDEKSGHKRDSRADWVFDSLEKKDFSAESINRFYGFDILPVDGGGKA